MWIKLLVVTWLCCIFAGCAGDGWCRDLRDQSIADIDAVLQANLSCTQDEDCTRVSQDTQCNGTCPVAVAKTGLSDVEQAIERADQEYCASHQALGCGYVTPGCMAMEPACQNDICVMVQTENP